MFYKGRTETIRPVSDFSCKFARLFDDPSAKDEEKKDALKKAIGQVFSANYSITTGNISM